MELIKLKGVEIEQLRQGRCPDCGEQLYKGPRGGIAMNVSCAHNHIFCVTPGLVFPPERVVIP